RGVAGRALHAAQPECAHAVPRVRGGEWGQAGACRRTNCRQRLTPCGRRATSRTRMRRLGRLPALDGFLFGVLSTVFVVFPIVPQARRDALVRGWSRMLLACCGVRVREVVRTGAAPLALQAGGRMLLANHVSWLDIFVINAVAPSSFVAKSEIARW